MIPILIAYGFNDVYIPCMVFNTFDEGLDFVTDILGPPTNLIKNGGDGPKAVWDGDNTNTIFMEDWDIAESYSEEPMIGGKYASYCEDPIEKAKVLGTSNRFFTNYCGGCGEVSQLTLRMVEPCKPFIPWDLD